MHLPFPPKHHLPFPSETSSSISSKTCIFPFLRNVVFPFLRNVILFLSSKTCISLPPKTMHLSLPPKHSFSHFPKTRKRTFSNPLIMNLFKKVRLHLSKKHSIYPHPAIHPTFILSSSNPLIPLPQPFLTHSLYPDAPAAIASSAPSGAAPAPCGTPPRSNNRYPGCGSHIPWIAYRKRSSPSACRWS